MKVLLTRLEKDCALTAKKLCQLGFQPIILPLSELLILSPIVANKTPDFTLFTSANGVNAVSDDLASSLKALPAYAVGPKTAEALSKKSYTNIRIGKGNAESLAQLILKDWSGKQFSGLYLCGVERSFDFSSTFAQFGKMELCEVYRFNELFPAQDMLETALESMVGGAILVYSAEGAKRIIRAFERANKLYVLKEAVIVAISGKAAKAFNSNATKQILTAAEPTEAEMLKVLKNLQT